MTFKRVAIISAGDGDAGADAAWQLSADGFDVAILSSSNRGEALADELDGICVIETRRSSASVQRLVDLALDRWGRIDVLVNSVDCSPERSMLRSTDCPVHAVMGAYLTDVVRPTRIVAPVLGDLGGGTIVNIVNVGAEGLDELAPAMGIFRDAMVNFCNLVDERHSADGVKMANIVPEAIVGQSTDKECGGGMPIWRFRRTEEISGLVACLVADTTHILDRNSLFDGRLTASHKVAA